MDELFLSSLQLFCDLWNLLVIATLNMIESDKNTYFMELLNPEIQRLSDFCRGVAHDVNVADDLLSDTILVAFENVHKLKDPSAFRYYLFGIASRLSKKGYRKQKRMTRWDDSLNDNLAGQQPSPEMGHDVEVLYGALDQLPKVMREAIVLFEISGFSIKEIATIQASSQSAVKSRLKRGREKLVRMLK